MIASALSYWRLHRLRKIFSQWQQRFSQRQAHKVQSMLRRRHRLTAAGFDLLQGVLAQVTVS